MPETVKGYFLPRKVSTPWPPPTSTIKPPFVTRLLVEAMSLECWAASFWEDSKKRLPRFLNTRIGRVATRMAGLQEKKFRLTSRGEREVMERWDPTDAVKAAAKRMNEDMNAGRGPVGTMSDAGKPVADAATVAVITTLAKLYQVVIIHRSCRRGVNQITKGTLNDARKALEGLPQPAHTLRAVAQIAKIGWGTEDCCRLAVATLKKAIREHSNALLTLPTSDATGDDTPARELWRDITILDVAVRDLEKDGAAEKLARKTWALAKKIGQEIDVDA